jgi:hypothetical protein
VSNKTWKRETAWVMLLGLFYVVLTVGMDWYGKQGPLNLGSKSGNSV